MTCKNLTYLTTQYNQFINITKDVLAAIQESGLQNGMVTVMTRHTTTGIMVNEALECLESDLADVLAKIAPEDHPYAHARMLKDYGSTAGNPTGHVKSMVVGNHCHLPVIDGEVVVGGAQEIYFCEFDGPAQRTIMVLLEGDA